MNDVPRLNTIDPITLEVLRNGLESIADEMGVVLKERANSPFAARDFFRQETRRRL